MARPRKADAADSAIYKIDAAFWRLLERMDFSIITMKLLAQETGVNRNTLYYHFANIQEVAAAVFNNVISDEISNLFIDTLLLIPDSIEETWEQMQLSDRVRKIRLFAKSDSPLLRSLLKGSLTARWFHKLNIRAERISPQEMLQIDYIVNGFIGMIGNESIAQDYRLLAAFPKSPIGKAAIQTLLQLSDRQK